MRTLAHTVMQMSFDWRQIDFGLLCLMMTMSAWALWNFDRLIRRLYDHFPEEWRKAGCPHGPFFVPPEVRGPLTAKGGSNTAYWKAQRWIFSTPNWVKEDYAAKSYLARVRLSLILSLFPFAALVIIGITRSS